MFCQLIVLQQNIFYTSMSRWELFNMRDTSKFKKLWPVWSSLRDLVFLKWRLCIFFSSQLQWPTVGLLHPHHSTKITDVILQHMENLTWPHVWGKQVISGCKVGFRVNRLEGKQSFHYFQKYDPIEKLCRFGQLIKLLVINQCWTISIIF